jgi:hypothetical protein
MSNVFSPRLDILPITQQRLWPELAQTPDYFILYGGTAIALRLGHRQSVDFDFFTLKAFQPHSLLEGLPYLKGAVVRKSSANNLTVSVDRGGPVHPLVSLKAISYHDDPSLAELPQDVRRDLVKAVKETDPHQLPVLNGIRARQTT